MPNRHPLTRDFQMYYVGTYVARSTPQGYQVMYVVEVTSDGEHETDIQDLNFHGKVYGPDGSVLGENRRWPGGEVENIIPRFGYYNFGDGPVYITYSPQNRTNRKGLDGRILLCNGVSFSLNGRKVATLFNQCEFPGQYGRDLCVYNNRILWKGMEVGTLRNGDVTIFKNKEHAKELVCKLLGKRLEVKQVEIQGE